MLRELLRSVAEIKLGPDSKAYKEINWVLERIKQQIANQRNTGVHTPLMSFADLTKNTDPENPPEVQILPLSMFGNKKAFSMDGKDLIKEYGDYEYAIRKLIGHTFAISYNVNSTRSGPETWPERPQLQRPAQNQTHKA